MWTLRLVSKLSDITCTCLALDLAITARAGHFTDLLKLSTFIESKLYNAVKNSIPSAYLLPK